MNSSFSSLLVILMLAPFSLQAAPTTVSLGHHILCHGETLEGAPQSLLISNASVKDDWESLTADIFLLHKGKIRELCQEAWLTGQKGDQIDDALGVKGDLYLECLQDDSNIVTHQVSLRKLDNDHYTGTFSVFKTNTKLGLKNGRTVTMQCSTLD